MQYNKYAIALVLLASSVFASSVITPPPVFNDVAQSIVDKTVKQEKEAIFNQQTYFPSDQVAGIINKTQTEIADALKKSYYLDVATKIHAAENNGKIGSVTLTGGLENVFTSEQFDKIKFYEAIASAALTAEQIQEFLMNNVLPKYQPDELAAAILTLDGTGLVSKITDLNKYVTENQMKVIELTEELNGVKLEKADLVEILKIEDDKLADKITELTNQKLQKLVVEINTALDGNKNFNDLEPAVVAKFNLSEDQLAALNHKNPAKDDANLIKYLTDPAPHKPSPTPTPSVEDKLTEKITAILALVEGDGKIGASDKLLELVDGDAKKVEAIQYQEEKSGKKITVDILKQILLAANEEALRPLSGPTTPVTTPNTPGNAAVSEEVNKKVTAILALTGVDVKLNTLSDDKFAPNQLSAEVIALIKEKEEKSGNKITEAELTAILTTPAPKQKPALTPEEKEKNAAKEKEDKKKQEEAENEKIKELVASVKKSLQNKAIKDLTKGDISPNLTEQQFAALMSANVSKDTSDADIEKILRGKAAPATGEKADLTGTENGAKTAASGETPFYATTWFISIIGILVVGAIGGGVYMMTRKSEETDL